MVLHFQEYISDDDDGEKIEMWNAEAEGRGRTSVSEPV